MTSYLKIVAAMLIWSTWGVLIRWIGQPPVVVLFCTSLIASFTVPAVLRARGALDLSGAASEWAVLLALGAASIVNNLTYFYALAHTTVANAVFTHYTAPLFVAVLAPLLIGERLQRVTLLSLPIAVAGMTLIAADSGGLGLSDGHSAGIVAGTVSGLAYALLIVLSRRLSLLNMHYTTVVALLWVTTAATAPFALSSLPELGPTAVALLLVTGILHSTLAPLMYYSALRQVIAQHAAILGYTEPLAAVPLAMVLLRESPTGYAAAGGLAVLASGYLIVRSAARFGR